MLASLWTWSGAGLVTGGGGGGGWETRPESEIAARVGEVTIGDEGSGGPVQTSFVYLETKTKKELKINF